MPFTAKAGELLPVYWRLVYPGDKFKLSHQHFTRTQPVNTAAFARIREYIDWYFVPMRLINKNLNQALVQMQHNPVQASSITASKVITTDLPHCFLSSGGAATSSLYSVINRTHKGRSGGKPILDFFLRPKTASMIKLMQYMRVGNFDMASNPVGNAKMWGYTTNPEFDLRINGKSNLAVNLLPFFAYQKVYADFFRFEQWENNEPFTYNCDYYSGGNILDTLDTTAKWEVFVRNNNFLTLRYANYPKDMFTGILPNQQLGEIATINVGDNSGMQQLVDLPVNVFKTSAGNPRPVSSFVGSAGSDVVVYTGKSHELSPGEQGTLRATGSFPVPGAVGSFNIIQLRMMEATQRFREISQVADQTYKGQLEAHWNVKLSGALSDKCMWIGGTSSSLDISEVENNNLVDSQATLKGKGVGSSQGSERFSSDEHGILLCIYHCEPILNHTLTGPDPELVYTNTADLPQPEFDKIGLQAIPSFLLFNDVLPSNPTGHEQYSPFPLGYLPRFFEAKTSADTMQGAFRTTLHSWVVTRDLPDIPLFLQAAVYVHRVSYPYFKINPSVLDSIFSVKADSTVDTDQFLVNFFADVKAVRNFDYDGMPY